MTELRVSYLLEKDTIALGAAISSGLLLFTLSRVRLVFLVSNPRD